MAPGAPGGEPRWTSSAKVGVGTALDDRSPVWFTHSHGILNEIYYPSVDSACLRDFGLLVTGGGGAFYEEKRDCISVCTYAEAGVPAFTLTNTAGDKSFVIVKEVIADPARASVVQRITFTPTQGAAGDFKVYVLVAPHLVNQGQNNTAWIGKHEGNTMLFASGQSRYLAVASSLGWRQASVGYVGTSDGWTLLKETGALTAYQRAEHGNVALTGEIGFDTDHPTAIVVLGFGATKSEAAAVAQASLNEHFNFLHEDYAQQWRSWQKQLLPLDKRSSEKINYYRTSTAVLASHRATSPRGGVVASLSIPWGASKGDNDIGGYHLVWPRDLVEIAGGFLAAGDAGEARAILDFLCDLQAPSGRWAQNFWLDGTAYWPGLQMDECAFPILLVDLLVRHGKLGPKQQAGYLQMVQRAAGFILMNGPVTGEDRWEEDAGYSTFTLAVEIAALLAAAALLDTAGDAASALHLRETADCWNEQIENWTLATNDVFTASTGARQYYVRMSGVAATDMASAMKGTIKILNREEDFAAPDSSSVVSPDALALVRFGLRAADDPRICDTVKVIDHLLRKHVPQGPLWYRYVGDGYGEHDDGAPFDGVGRGRLWPLLAGERAHYEVAAGHFKRAEALLKTFEDSASAGGLLPEQTWDAEDIAQKELYFGQPSGSAMPLAWAHAEHIKLLRSLRDGAVFDMPSQTVARYIKNQSPSQLRIWRFNNRLSSLPQGKTLRLEIGARASIHWSADGWRSVTDTLTRATAFGSHFADLDMADILIGQHIAFTFYWIDAQKWEGSDFTVEII